ncbi:MAG TPA: UvrD-helicase domain-containing protein [Polyangiaceae bacterium]
MTLPLNFGTPPAKVAPPEPARGPDGLNEPQRLAVVHGHGPLLVFAGAGSGKTRAITYRVANLLATHQVPPFRILAVTFTNKAAGEMRERLTTLAGAEVVRDLWIGTFHSVCSRLLRRYHPSVGLDKNFVIYDDSDQKAVMTRALRDLGIDDEALPPKLVLSLVSREKREGRYPNDPKSELTATARQAYEGYQNALLRANAVDFDDLLLHMLKVVEEENSVPSDELRNRFSHVLVDEFQDTNLVQYRIVRALSARTRNLCVVGDDDQSIYRWRGADVRLIRSFQRDFPDATVVKLEQNYRSTGNIVAAALGVIEKADERVDKKLWTASDPGDKVLVRAVRDEREEASDIVNAVKRLGARGVTPDHIAIFYRVHAQSRTLEEALRAGNVPYQVIGGMRFFERAEVKNLVAYLRLALNPASDADLERIINVPTRGIGDKTVDRLKDIAAENTQSLYQAIATAVRTGDIPSAAKKKLEAFHAMMEGFRKAVETTTPSELAERVLEETGYKKTLVEADDAEADARLGNLEELIGAISDYEEETTEQGEPATLAGWLERITLAAAVDSLEDAPKVSLMTVHTAKGLEFEAVFLTGMEEEIFPYRGVSGREPEELDEERRLAYVAITRARRHLTITHAMMRSLFGTTRYLEPSRFLADIPEDAMRQENAPGTLAEGAPRSLGGGRFTGFRSGGGGGYGYGRAQSEGYGSYGRESYARKPSLSPGTRVVERDEEPAGDEEGSDVRPGDRVRHARYGVGIVEGVEHGAAPMIVARFGVHGTRRILASYLSLERRSR